MDYQNRIDLARQAKLLSGNTASFGGSMELGENLKVEGGVAFIGLEPYTGATSPNIVVIGDDGQLYESDSFPEINDEVISTGTTYSSDKITSLVSAKLYHHYQEYPSDTWDIPHDLGDYCFIQIFINGVKVESNIKHINTNNSQITFSKPQVGLAICMI